MRCQSDRTNAASDKEVCESKAGTGSAIEGAGHHSSRLWTAVPDGEHRNAVGGGYLRTRVAGVVCDSRRGDDYLVDATVKQPSRLAFLSVVP
jgi:hypothetical protein